MKHDVALSTGYIGPLAKSSTAVEKDSWGKIKSQ